MFQRMLSFVIMAAIALGAAPVAAAAGGAALAGRVVDPRGAAVSHAQVTLYSRDYRVRLSTVTDDGGAYRFDNLARGEYLVEAAAPGFARTDARSVRVEDGAATADVSLELQGVREQVVVTATDTPQNAHEASKAVTVVGDGQIEARDEFAVTEAIRHVPGVRVQQLGGPGSFTSVKIRGLRNEDTAVLVDGFRFRDVAAPQGDASAFLEDLVVTNLDRVEVLRGSGSSVYGTNAIGGVVNLVTDSGGGRTRGSVLAEGGTLGLFRGQARIAGGWLDDRIVYSAGLSHLNVWDGVDEDDAARTSSGQGRVMARLGPTASLTGRIYSARSFLQLNEGPVAVGALPPTGVVDAVALSDAELARYEAGTPASTLSLAGATFIPSANDPDNAREGDFLTGAVTFSHRPADGFGYSVAYHGLRTDRAFSDGPGGVSYEPFVSTRSEFDGRIHTLAARADVDLGRVSLLNVGYELESETFVNRSLSGASAGDSSVDVTQRNNTFWVQDQLRLAGGRLQIAGGFRAQWFELDEPFFTPAASAPYQGIAFEAPPAAYTGDGSVAYLFPDSGTKLRAHVGNGYRAPSLYERFGTYFSSFFGYSVFGDPRLAPDRSIGIDAGIDQSLFDNRARVSATWFYTRLREVIVFDFSGAIDPTTDPFGRFGGYLNTGGGLSRGLEIGFAASPDPSLDLELAYTYTNADQRRPLVGDVLRTFNVPDHQVSLVATQRIGSRFGITFDLAATSDYLTPIFDPSTFASRAYRFDGLLKADLGASYTLPLADERSVRFYGKVENLFDREYFESGFRTPGASLVSGLQFRF